MIEMRVVRWPDGREQFQFRHWLAYAAANGNAMFPLQPEWSEWKDVLVADGDRAKQEGR